MTILTVALGVTVMWSAFAVAIFGRHLGDYYRTDLRAGEIALGGLYAVWSTRASRSAAESGAGSTVGSRLLVNGGLAGIVALFVTVRRDYWLLQPVVLLIAATLGVVIVHGLLGALSSELLAKGGTHGGLLASRPVQFVGLISYSLYLVHWPIIQAVTPARLGLGVGATQAVCAGTSIVVAWLVYRFVEAPLRRSHGPARNVFAMWAACLIVMLGLFAI